MALIINIILFIYEKYQINHLFVNIFILIKTFNINTNICLLFGRFIHSYLLCNIDHLYLMKISINIYS